MLRLERGEGVNDDPADASTALTLAKIDPPARTFAELEHTAQLLMNFPIFDEHGNKTGETYSLLDTPEKYLAFLDYNK